MPSPFPGMNPYLEREVVWHDFHERFLIFGAGIIGAQVRPDYVVRVDDHVFIDEPADEPRRAVGRVDLGIARTIPAVEHEAVLEAPARIRVPQVDITREVFLEVIDRRSREVVTVIELLSPSSKRKSGVNRLQYLAKRTALLASRTHLVEIDLLRGGEPMPGEDRPECCYSFWSAGSRSGPTPAFGPSPWPIGCRPSPFPSDRRTPTRGSTCKNS